MTQVVEVCVNPGPWYPAPRPFLGHSTGLVLLPASRGFVDPETWE